MATVPAVVAFLAGALVSLATSWLLVSRLERVGERLGLSEALLGIVAALAADAPEVTAAVTAMASGEQRLGAGVVIGSNVFNLAALLGLGAVVAEGIGLHRKVVVLGGAAATCVAGICLAVVLGVLPPAAGCLLGLFVVALYMAALGVSGQGLARLRLPRRWTSWLRSAVAEEEAELEAAIRPVPGRWPDVVVAAVALVIVVAASVTMERAASALGNRFAIPEIVVGGLVLAAVTSLPNAVAAVYLAARGRGAATLSTALNSNTLNVAAGLLIPAALTGLGRPSGQTILAAVWYLGLTVVILAFAYRDRGIWRVTGSLVIAAYFVFAASILALAYAGPQGTRIAIAAGLAVAAVFAARLVLGRRSDASGNEPVPSPPRPARRNRGDPETQANLQMRPTGAWSTTWRRPEEAFTMEYLVTMTTHVPDGTSEAAVQDIRTREAARSRELAQGHLRRLWRPPLQPGEWRTLGLFGAADDGHLEEVLASMPLRVWRTDEVTPLWPHPNDPARQAELPGSTAAEAGDKAAEFLTIFTVTVPDGTSAQAVEDTQAREAQRARELAGQGHLVRLWALAGQGRTLGLWRAQNVAGMQAIVKSLPLYDWMTVQTTPLTPHPSDSALSG